MASAKTAAYQGKVTCVFAVLVTVLAGFFLLRPVWDYYVHWTSGARHPKVANIVAGDERGRWRPVSGYVLKDEAKPLKGAEWAPGKRELIAPHVFAGALEGTWEADPGYVLKNVDDPLADAEWTPGARLPAVPYIFAGASEGKWETDPGYVLKDAGNALAGARWEAGLAHPDDRLVTSGQNEREWRVPVGYRLDGTRAVWIPEANHPTVPNIVAGAEGGSWIVAPGYALKDAADPLKGAVWTSGLVHPKYAHVVARTEEGSWGAAPGHKLRNPDDVSKGVDSAGDALTIALADGVTMDLVWCPPGTFWMGSPEDEAGRVNDETRRRVTLTRGFWMGKYEVTQRQWAAVMGDGLEAYAGKTGDIGAVRGDHPMVHVSWEDCQAFMAKLNEKIAGRQFRLPTEAEWEYACRAGTETATYAGPMEIKGKNNALALDAVAWYGGNSSEGYDIGAGWKTADWPERQYSGGLAGYRVVGAKQPNAWGLYDMLGNVWEWCGDWHKAYPTMDATDPDGARSGSHRVARGGGWDSHARMCRSAYRHFYFPTIRYYTLGFRVACPLPDEPKGTDAVK